MRLVHTLLFLLRENSFQQDIELATKCLKTLEKSTYKTVVIYNQGFFTNEQLKTFLSQFDLDCIVIGDAANVGTVVVRQSCFEYIWQNLPSTEYISEIHLDMIFTYNWEDVLVDYLFNNDEPMISCGIIDINGQLAFLDSKPFDLPDDQNNFDNFLSSLRQDKVVHGFTNPCIHVSKAIHAIGGYNSLFLKGKQCYEDDSILLGYYYYYGTRANWHPKVNYNSVVFHSVAGQRLGLNDSVLLNYDGLVKQYGTMGLKHLSQLHKSQWHKNFFNEQYNKLL